MSQNFPKWPLWLSLGAYLVLTAALIVAVPLGASPDEAAHWQYVEHIAQTGTLPVFRATSVSDPGYEFHQPPLYYLICAPLWKLLGTGVQNYACRVVSLLCGLGTIALIWSAARLLFSSNLRIAGAAAGVAAFLPLHQGVGAGSNNDALGGLICATLFFLMARFMVNGVTRRDVWQVGVVAGLGILTKNTALSVAIVALGALFWAARRENSSVSSPTALAMAFGLALLLGGPWLARNISLYGDPLVQTAFKAAFPPMGISEFAQGGIGLVSYLRGFLWVAFGTTWGFFGGPNSLLEATRPLAPSGPRVPQLALAPLMALCALFPLACALGWRRIDALDDAQKTTLRVWSIGILFVLLAWAQFAAQYFAGAQARYGHAALLPLCVLLAAGWVALWRSGRSLVLASLVVGASLILLTLLNVFGWKTLV
ncbi:MAG: glycosyltransferase family 39 protein [Armatimonadetes bacterium]|nr:glycosyltransferase family 39 protein [Armatimonadota bacterium]